MRLGQTSVVYTAARVAGSALGFLATVYFARVLGDAVLGQYALVLALATWVLVVGQAGLSRSLTKRISEGDDRAQFLAAGFVVAGAVAVVGGAVVVAADGLVTSYVGASVTGLLVALLAVRLFRVVVGAALNGGHLVHVNSVLGVGGRLVRNVTQVGLVVLGWRLAGMIVGYVLSTLVVGLVGLWYLDVRPAVPRRRHFRSLFDFAKYAWLENVSQRFYGTLDITVLGVFVASGLVGVYSVVWSVVVFLTIFGTGIRETLFPEMSQLSADENVGAVGDLTEQALAYSGLILVPGIVGGVLIDGRLLRVYGPSFVEGTRVFGVLAAAALLWTYNRQLLNTLAAVDRADLAFRSNGLFVLANAALNLGLVPAYGIVGAAVATLCSAGLGLVTSYRYAGRIVEFGVPGRALATQWAAALLMGAVVYGGRAVLEGSALARWNAAVVAVLAGGGAAVYFATLLGVSPQFRTTVVRNLPSAGRWS
jgi:O-antigen/teichoic acid export membrane protein